VAWAIDFGDGVPRHPTALYEALFMADMAFLFALLEKRLPRGALFRVFVATYLSFRMFVDLLKPGEPLVWNLTAIQWACIAGVVIVIKRVILDAAQEADRPAGVPDRS
jgi:prolipoprotein diacylglyceryltransferase